MAVIRERVTVGPHSRYICNLGKRPGVMLWNIGSEAVLVDNVGDFEKGEAIVIGPGAMMTIPSAGVGTNIFAATAGDGTSSLEYIWLR